MGCETATEAEFFIAFDEFIKEAGKLNDWTSATRTKFEAVKKHLEGFDPAITFDAFDEDRLSDYVTYLREVKQMRSSTAGKQTGFLGWFLRWAFRKGFLSCCRYHAELAKLQVFNINDFKKVPDRTAKKMIYTWQHIKITCSLVFVRTASFVGQRVISVFERHGFIQDASRASTVVQYVPWPSFMGLRLFCSGLWEHNR